MIAWRKSRQALPLIIHIEAAQWLDVVYLVVLEAARDALCEAYRGSYERQRLNVTRAYRLQGPAS
jgi:hypothetical protein